jgi:hypothetical protein
MIHAKMEGMEASSMQERLGREGGGVEKGRGGGKGEGRYNSFSM